VAAEPAKLLAADPHREGRFAMLLALADEDIFVELATELAELCS